MGLLKRKPAAVLDGSLLVRKGQGRPLFTVESGPPMQPACRPARAAPRRGHDEGKTVATTVRLDEDLYLRLKLYASHTDRTRQDILRSAVERYLADGAAELGGECGCLNRE